MKTRVKLQQVFELILMFYIIANMLSQTEFAGLFRVGAIVLLSRLLIYSFAFVQLVTSSFLNKIQLILLTILIVVSIVITLFSEKNLIIDTLVILIIARQYDVYKLLWDCCRVQIVVLATIVVLSLIGVIDNTSQIRMGTYSVREGLGFIYTTFAPNFFFHIVLSYIVIKGNKMKLFHIILLELVNIFFYIKTDTKAAFFMCGIFVLVAYLIKYKQGKIEDTIIIKSLYYLIIPISVFAAFFTAMFYDPSDYKWVKLNLFLSGRLVLAHRAMLEYRIHPIGQFVQWNTSLSKYYNINAEYFYVDSSYINIALVYGWIMLALVCTAYFVLMKWGIKNNKQMLCLAISFLALHSIFDPQLIELRYNLLLLPIASILNPQDFRINITKTLAR